VRTGILTVLAFFALAIARAEASEPKLSDRSSDAGQAATTTNPISENDLAGISGGDAVLIDVQTKQNLTATVKDNNITADSVETGAINFGNNALNGFNGIGNFVINTGNNNVLQGSLSVTIINAPTP
jgi:hypothetical protein